MIELVPNFINKYVVVSYTEGLEFNPDGSLSIYLATELPSGVPLASWLPLPDRSFIILSCVPTAGREVSVTILMFRRVSIGDIDLG